MKFVSLMAAMMMALVSLPVWAAEVDESARAEAIRSGRMAGHSLDKVHRWLHEVALPRIDAKTGLYIADGKWNYRDTAADCYPFLTWAAWTVDREALNGPVRAILDAERATCNFLDGIPLPYDLEAGKLQEVDWDEMVFQASEYVKDGLIAIVEVTGKDEWFDRMREIEDGLWKNARVDTPFGKIVSENIEVNGEQIQALTRLYTMTGDPDYLMWAERLADYYLSQENFVPNRLRDHGCEIIGGLGLLMGVESEHNPSKEKEYAAKLKIVFDTILAKGCNEDGMMFNTIKSDQPNDARKDLSDGWGYNYVAYLCYDMAAGKKVYAPQVRSVLGNLSKPLYRDFPWEGESIDGYADSIEGGLYLLNRLPVAEGLAWADRETMENVVDHPTRLENGELWGTMKLQANGVRTTLIHALMHTQGLTAHPWQQGLQLGTAPIKGGIVIMLQSGQDYAGHLEFDIPRHRLYMGFEQDWPRMNTLPEWFVVEPDSAVPPGGRRWKRRGRCLYRTTIAQRAKGNPRGGESAVFDGREEVGGGDTVAAGDGRGVERSMP